MKYYSMMGEQQQCSVEATTAGPCSKEVATCKRAHVLINEAAGEAAEAPPAALHPGLPAARHRLIQLHDGRIASSTASLPCSRPLTPHRDFGQLAPTGQPHRPA